MERLPLPILAHAFGQNFSLPLPVWMFMFGGVGAVLLSFVVMSLLPGRVSGKDAVLVRLPVPFAAQIQSICGVLGVLALLILIVTGLFGSPYAIHNLNVTFCWVIFWVGFTYLVALFGNLWAAFNPFFAIVRWIEHGSPELFKGVRSYPKQLAYYPALLGYIVVICIELLFKDYGTLPMALSGLLLFYVFVTIIGCMYFGRKAWFQYCDFFSVFFGLVSLLSVLGYSKGSVEPRRPFAGLMQLRVTDTSLLVFIVFMLASTTFDGFKEVRQYAQLEHVVNRPADDILFGCLTLICITTVLLLGYLLFSAATKRVESTKLTARRTVFAFAPSLVPIAIGYNVAHYFAYLVTTGQSIIPQLSDPFSIGWNIFGTAQYTVNPAILSPYASWYVQLGAIISGHVVAVYVAHRIALRMYGRRDRAVRSQAPLVILMLLYTFMSLWIVAQPVYVAIARSTASKTSANQ